MKRLSDWARTTFSTSRGPLRTPNPTLVARYALTVLPEQNTPQNTRLKSRSDARDQQDDLEAPSHGLSEPAGPSLKSLSERLGATTAHAPGVNLLRPGAIPFQEASKKLLPTNLGRFRTSKCPIPLHMALHDGLNMLKQVRLVF